MHTMSKLIMVILVLGLVLAPLAFAGCALDAYKKACGSCSFDQYGKIDQSCSGGYTAGGTACVSTSYPIMAAEYAAGKCPAVDSCASELQSCMAQVSTGDDRADCQEGSAETCYSAADVCTREAAVKCGEVDQQACGGSTATFILLLAGLFYVRIRKN